LRGEINSHDQQLDCSFKIQMVEIDVEVSVQNNNALNRNFEEGKIALMENYYRESAPYVNYIPPKICFRTTETTDSHFLKDREHNVDKYRNEASSKDQHKGDKYRNEVSSKDQHNVDKYRNEGSSKVQHNVDKYRKLQKELERLKNEKEDLQLRIDEIKKRENEIQQELQRNNNKY